MQKLNREQLLFVYRIDLLSSLLKRIGQFNSNKNNLSPIAQPAIRAKKKKEKKKDTYLPTNIQQ